MAINFRRLVLAIGFILVTIGIGAAIYFIFFRPFLQPGVNANDNVNVGVLPAINDNRNITPTNGNVNVGLPITPLTGPPSTVAQGGLTTVNPIASTVPGGATLATNGRDLLYYDPITGQFYQISPDGRTKTLLTPDEYPAVERITWSPLRDKAVIEFPDQTKFLYDFRQKRQYTLAPEMEDISFSPGSDRISFKFIGQDPDDRFLAISRFDGSESRTVEPLGDKENQFNANWSPSGNVVGTFHESVDANRQRVIPIGQLGENFPAFTLPGRGFQGEWSPDGEQLLYSVFNKESGFNPVLHVASGATDNFGGQNTNLDIQTWPDKCTFASGSTVYCAVPQYLDQGAGLFPDTAANTPDDFYRLDLSTGTKQLIARPVTADGEANFVANELQVSSDQTLLYFYDERTKQMQKLQLK